MVKFLSRGFISASCRNFCFLLKLPILLSTKTLLHSRKAAVHTKDLPTDKSRGVAAKKYRRGRDILFAPDPPQWNPLRQLLVKSRIIQLKGIDGRPDKCRRDGVAGNPILSPFAGQLARVHVDRSLAGTVRGIVFRRADHTFYRREV